MSTIYCFPCQMCKHLEIICRKVLLWLLCVSQPYLVRSIVWRISAGAYLLVLLTIRIPNQSYLSNLFDVFLSALSNHGWEHRLYSSGFRKILRFSMPNLHFKPDCSLEFSISPQLLHWVVVWIIYLSCISVFICRQCIMNFLCLYIFHG